MIRAVVFDLWNTLVHSPGENPFQLLGSLLTPHQFGKLPDLQRDGMTRAYTDAEAFIAAWDKELHFSPEQKEGLTAIFKRSEEEARLYPETLEILARTRSLARVAMLSNTQSFSLGLLDSLELSAHFRVKGISAELGFLKPELGAFEAVQKKLGLFPGELAMVGDSWSDDVEGALNAGWTALWVNRKGKPRPDHAPDAELVEIADLSLVPEVIERLQAGARCSTCLG
ncbi:MAG: HAD family hydrolase [Acidobacteriota bacterium]|nr:HAD family hydrolase [Acidobacteriota bacterium]